MTTYEPASVEVLALLDEVMKLHHPPLLEEGVRVGVLMAHAEEGGEDDEPKPAITHNGVPALAKVKIVSLKDRAHGMPDVEMLIDALKWNLLNEKERAALIDHELTHLQFVVKKGEVVLDDLKRPKLKMRPHDFEFGWFKAVAERHGDASQEQQQARAMFDQAGGAFWPHLQERPVVEVPRAAPPTPKEPELFAEEEP